MQISAPGANAACDGFVNACDSGGAGDVHFHTSGDAEVALCVLNNPAFGAASSGDAAMLTGTAVEDTSTSAGTIDHAHLRQNDNTILSQFTCGVGTGEIQFSSLTFGSGETLTVTALTVSWTDTSLT